MRGVTDLTPKIVRRWLISTRTPHAGSDRLLNIQIVKEIHFNPHSPCGE